jgi:hypothetical protein
MVKCCCLGLLSWVVTVTRDCFAVQVILIVVDVRLSPFFSKAGFEEDARDLFFSFLLISSNIHSLNPCFAVCPPCTRNSYIYLLYCEFSTWIDPRATADNGVGALPPLAAVKATRVPY